MNEQTYWIGQERAAVEITYGGATFYIDDEGYEPTDEARADLRARAAALREGGAPWQVALADQLQADVDRDVCGYPGWGWVKVTEGRGSPQCGHASLLIDRVVESSPASGGVSSGRGK